jgi:hypothetical protein
MAHLLLGIGVLEVVGMRLQAAAVALLLIGAAPAPPVRYDAVAVNMSNVGRTTTMRIDVTIERWTTPEEQGRLHDLLTEKGADHLLEALQDIEPRAGFIATPGKLGWDIHYAQRSELPGGGHRVIFATDRPMSFFERSRSTRSSEYEFMVAEMRLGPDGTGEGKLIPRARIDWDGETRTIEVEDFANEPVRLTQIREERKD